MNLPFQLTLSLTFKDLINFNINHHKKSYKFFAFVFVLLIINLFFVKTEGHEVFTPLLAIPVITLLIFSIITYIKSKKNLSENKKDFENITYLINDEYFEIYNENTDIKTKWKTFKFLKENKNYFFLYPNKNMAFIIPKKHLSDTEAEELLLFLKSKMKTK